MSEDASLDSSDRSNDGIDAETDSLRPTFSWSPDGECDGCGETAERRWRDDGELVCDDCKEW